MDFQLKQWREEQEQQNQSKQEEQQQHPHSAKIPRFFLDSYTTNKINNNNINNNNNDNITHQSDQEESVIPLPLFVPDQPTSKICSSNLSGSYFPDSTAVTATKYPRMGSYFSLAQWQELELQALIFRHMLAGSPVPHELLHLVKKSLLASSPYYLHNNIQHFPYFHQSMLQSGYWGKGAMDPEPGRCRRTDGKKWRCSRDVVAGHKYCERHVHRGRNRSRKPVEIPTPTAASTGGNTGGGMEKPNDVAAAMAAATGGRAHSGPSYSVDLLHLNERPSDPTISLKNPFETERADYAIDGKSSDRILRPFFDDWPRSLQESDNVGSNISSVTSTTNLSISTPGNPSSDFSLKLATGSNVYDNDQLSQSTERDQHHSQFNVPSWGTNQVASMGGPLAEALRSSTNSSPTSVLFQLPGRTGPHASYVSS